VHYHQQGARLVFRFKKDTREEIIIKHTHTSANEANTMLTSCKVPGDKKSGAFPTMAENGKYLQDPKVEDGPVERSRKDIWKSLRCAVPSTELNDGDGSFSVGPRGPILQYSSHDAVELFYNMESVGQSKPKSHKSKKRSEAESFDPFILEESEGFDFFPTWADFETAFNNTDNELFAFDSNLEKKAGASTDIDSTGRTEKTSQLSDEDTSTDQKSGINKMMLEDILEEEANRVMNASAEVKARVSQSNSTGFSLSRRGKSYRKGQSQKLAETAASEKRRCEQFSSILASRIEHLEAVLRDQGVEVVHTPPSGRCEI
jgi:hypothetical protein